VAPRQLWGTCTCEIFVIILYLMLLHGRYCCVVNRSVVADASSPSEDLRDAAWYQPGIPRSVMCACLLSHLTIFFGNVTGNVI